MINLRLTNNEWYALHIHIENLLKQYPDNRYLNSIMVKLAENCPTIQSIIADTKKETLKAKFKREKEFYKYWKEKYPDKKCHVINYNNVPEEFQQQKILSRQTSDGNDNKIQMFIKWLKDEWNGSKIGIADIKAKFEISDKYWGKLNSNPVVKDIKKKRKVKTMREGKGSSQRYYWYIK